jgi:hypothetical protein
MHPSCISFQHSHTSHFNHEDGDGILFRNAGGKELWYVDRRVDGPVYGRVVWCFDGLNFGLWMGWSFGDWASVSVCGQVDCPVCGRVF